MPRLLRSLSLVLALTLVSLAAAPTSHAQLWKRVKKTVEDASETVEDVRSTVGDATETVEDARSTVAGTVSGEGSSESSSPDGITSASSNCRSENNFDCAPTMALNTRLKDISGTNYYRVDVPQQGSLQIQVDPSTGLGRVDLQLYDAEHRKISEKSLDFDNRVTTGSLGASVQNGTYYVMAGTSRHYRNWYTLPYSLTVLFEEPERIGPSLAPTGTQATSAPASGAQMNAAASGTAASSGACQANTSARCASELPLDLRMGGTFADGARSRFYRMVVSQGGTLQLALDPAPKDGWTLVKVLDRSQKSLGAQQFDAGASGTYEVEVEPGIIYIEAFNESSKSGTAFGLKAAFPEN